MLNLRRWSALFLLIILLLPACENRRSSNKTDDDALPPNAIQLIFTYGSEKEAWIKDVTAQFNQSNRKIGNGKTINIKAIAMGSGDCVDEILNNRRQAHIISPASAAFIKLGNAQSQAKTGKDLIGAPETLMLSPVVIAMWRPMAEALGWGKKPIGWSDILSIARNPQGWGAYGHPEWGKFKFGHTHPEFSNSGLISLFAEVYAATNKTTNLTLDDVNKPATGEYLNGIEQAIVHYGTSTGFFGNKMFSNGPEYLSAAVLYENMVIDSAKSNPILPVVAIYPKEGTFWSDHPIGIVDKEWVTPEHREAAQIYIKYLLDKPQQQKTLTYGFRPGDAAIALDAPFDAAHGVDAKEPKTTLEVPSVEVMDAITKLWRQHKKASNVVLVFDTSGSMQEENRMPNAKNGAYQLIQMLDDRDLLSLLPFNNIPTWSAQRLMLGKDRDTAMTVIQGLFPSGGTALYDSIDTAYQYLLANPTDDKISAVIVLTDGADTDSRTQLQTLLSNIKFDNEKHSIRVFTIGYGAQAKQDILKNIADTTQAKFYEGTPDNIQSVFKEISTFF